MSTRVLVKLGDKNKNINNTDIEFYIDSTLEPHLSINRVWEILDKHSLSPSQDAIDFFRFSAAVYACDLRIKRSNGYDGWTRQIELHFPVINFDKWNACSSDIEELLSFLTGDLWSINFYETEFKRPKPVAYEEIYNRINTNKVSLFSGGLDSYIGVSDLLSKDESIYCVSHYDDTSSNHAKPAQDRCFGQLKDLYTSQEFEHLNFYANVPTDISDEKENTTRSRSIIFIGLGTLVASALNGDNKLYVPENGFIALNIPLGHSRIGSFTTRTTHPHVITTINKILDNLSIDVSVKNPYYYQTKGEMIQNMENREDVLDTLGETMSCAHPAQRRYEDRKEGGIGHCGYCYPCLIRRAAMEKNNIDDASKYTYDVSQQNEIDELTKGKKKDLNGLYNAIERLDHINKSIVLKPGHIDTDTYDIGKLYSMYTNGLNEIDLLLP